MNLFTKEIVIHSNKSVLEITEILKSVTGKTFPFGKVFLGKEDDDCFELRTVFYYKNSLAPKLYGIITVQNDGTDIHIKAEPFAKNLLIILMSMCVLLLLYAFINSILPAINEGFTEYNLFQVIVTIPFAIVLFVIANLAFLLPTKTHLIGWRGY